MAYAPCNMNASSSRPRIFVSYRRSHSAAVRPVVVALESVGIDCFFDVDNIDPLADFPERIREGIDSSHAMLVWWSADYAESEHCMAELRRAWQHARRHSSDVGRRVWVLNPEPTARHVLAGELNSNAFLAPPAASDARKWARNLRAQLEALLAEGPLADERTQTPVPKFFGLPTPTARFTGRGATMFRIHSALFPARIGGAALPPSVYLWGMGGLGKSELAAQYAHDFASAYPGGVFWLSFADFDPERLLLNATDGEQSGGLSDSKLRLKVRNAAERAAFRALERLFDSAPDLQTALLRDSKGKPLPTNRARRNMAAWLDKSLTDGFASPYLWIMDAVPSLSRLDLRQVMVDCWRAPTAAGRTVLTTRDARVAPGFAEVALDELEDSDALRLLSRFQAIEDEETSAARALVAAVGGHSLALTLLGERVRRDGDYKNTLRSLQEAGTLDRLEQIANRLRQSLGAAARGVIATFEVSIEPLPEDAKQLLELVALCAPSEPIPRQLLRCAYGGDEYGDAFADAADALLAASLLSERRKKDALDIHPLVADVVARLKPLRAEGGDSLLPLKQLAEALCLVVMTPQRVVNPSEWPFLNACKPHAEAVLEHLATAIPRRDYVRLTAALSFLLIKFAIEQGLDAEAAERAAWALVACALDAGNGTPAIPVELPEVNALIKEVPHAISRGGQVDEAVQLQRHIVEALKAHIPAEDPQCLCAEDDLADLLRRRGERADLKESEEIYERTVQAWRKLDPTSMDTLTALNNLALVAERQGDVGRAASLYEEVLAGLSGMDELGTRNRRAMTKANLAECLSRTNPTRALALFGEALSEAEVLGYPDTHWLKLKILTTASATAHRAAEWHDVREYLVRALPVLAEIQGERDPEVTRFAWALFDAVVRLGDGTTADETRTRYLAWLDRIPPDERSEEQERIVADIDRRTIK